MKMKTSELTGVALDWAVAKCEGRVNDAMPASSDYIRDFKFYPSTDWSQGGPIIEREQFNLACLGDVWEAWPNHGMNDAVYCKGPTPLVAVMRCYVASKLGDTVNIPEGLA